MWKWTTKKISYVGVLIGVAVVFVLIGSMLFAITTYPSFKISFAGLPVKLTGYLFGPLIGAVTGFLTDIISFMFLPTFYHPGYSLTMAITGMVPGIIMWIMIKNRRSLNTHFFVTLSVLVLIWIGMFVLFWLLPADVLENPVNLIQKRWIYLVLGAVGVSLNIILLVIFRFSLSPKNFVIIAPIILFTSLLGTINVFMLPIWDNYLFGIPYLLNLAGHYLLTEPIKLWFNILTVYIAWKIVSPILFKSNNNAW